MQFRLQSQHRPLSTEAGEAHGDARRSAPVPVFQDLEEVVTLGLLQGADAEVIQKDQVEPGEPSEELCCTSRLPWRGSAPRKGGERAGRGPETRGDTPSAPLRTGRSRLKPKV